MPASTGWVCFNEATPEIKYFASSDHSGEFPGLVCIELAEAPPGVGATSWYKFWKLLQLIEQLP